VADRACDISVVIVSYNTRDLLDACVESIADAVRAHNYEILVADNGSSDGSVDMLRRNWPNVRVIELGINLGFACANNVAIRRAHGRYVLLLNSDAEAAPGAIDTLLEFADSRPDAGICAPRLLNSDLSDQGTARTFPTPANVVFGRKSSLTRAFPRNRWSRRYMIGRQHAGDEAFRVDWVSGACMLVRRAAFEQAGLLDEGFFMYWEDADWCRRIGRAGFNVYCVPRARVVHHEGGSSGRRPARLVWAFHRSVYRYYAKHEAPQVWNPLRVVAAVGLTARAASIVAVNFARSR
jgi:GT2 family glycosyltransferase